MNRVIFWGLVVSVVVLLLIGFFWFIKQTDGGVGNSDEMCIRVQTTCCPCNMGGEEICALESEASEYRVNSSKCSPTMICAAVFNCEIESCEYIDGDCVLG